MGNLHYIFSINAGRSGSDYLAELLSLAANTVSIHEGFPLMNGAPMRQFNNGDPSALSALMPSKLKEIQKGRKHQKTIYCETNHSFIKGWGYLIPDEHIPQEDIGIVILRREPEKIAYSLLRCHDVPGRSEWTRTWYLEPEARHNLSRPSAEANVYELCRWYVDEISLRAEDYKTKFPRIHYFDCDLEQLNNGDFVLEMFEAFGLVPTPGLKSACGKVLNPRDEWPRLPLQELLSPSRYPSADHLPPRERDNLVQKMVRYLHEAKAAEIAAATPDYAMGGTLVSATTRIAAHSEMELEERFHYALKFTETEYVLFVEFLRSLAPKDLMFVSFDRKAEPGIAYTYDFNISPGVGIMIRKLGISGLFKAIRLIFRGLWGKDYSHREAKVGDI